MVDDVGKGCADGVGLGLCHARTRTGTHLGEGGKS